MKIVAKLYDHVFFGTANQARKAILSNAEKNKFTSVQFAYFAALKLAGWYEGTQSEEYEKALLESDFLLPDGIALRLLYYRYKHEKVSPLTLLLSYRYYARMSVANLNGTDFLPYFLERLDKPDDYRLVIYGTFPDIVESAAAYARQSFRIETVFQDGYRPFDFSMLSETKANILLVWLGAPKQEVWIRENQKELTRRGRVIAFGIGGLLDFWGGREKRAPKIVRQFSLEWLWRLITKPKKNGKKVLTSLLFFRELFR